MKQGLEEAGVLTAENKRLTAQQTWPFVAAAYSTQGTPRPCWFIIQLCDEIDQLIAYLRRAGNCGNGYYKKRLPALLAALNAYKNNSAFAINFMKGTVFSDIPAFKDRIGNLTSEQKKPFTPAFLKKYPLSDQVNGSVPNSVQTPQSSAKQSKNL